MGLRCAALGTWQELPGSTEHGSEDPRPDWVQCWKKRTRQVVLTVTMEHR